MRTILAPLDFSAASLNAVNYAADMALSIHANLDLLHVYSIPVMPAELPMPASVYNDLQDDLADKMEQLVTKLNVRTGNKIKIGFTVLAGSIDHELAEYCKVNQPFAVILGMKHNSATTRFLFGSTVFFAVKHLHCPVISVPEGAGFCKPGNIGLACDLHKLIDAAHSKQIEEVLSAFEAKLHVIHAVKDKRNIDAEVVAASGTLQNHFYHFRPQFHFPEELHIEQGINDFAKKQGLDMLIVIPQKHSFLESLLFKEHTKEFIVHQRMPVLTIRA